MDIERLVELRNDHGLSQKELAAILGVSQAAYSKYERGETQPRHATMVKLAEYFNVSVEYLLGITRDVNAPRVQSCAFLLENIPEQAAAEVRTFLQYIKEKYKL